MGIVESINKNKSWSYGAVIAMFVLAGAILIYELKPAKQFSQKESYFSDDDGASWYLDDINNIPPYDHNSRQAVRAMIYSYSGGSKQFCGFLMKFEPDVRGRIEAAASSAPSTSAQIAYGIEFAQQAEVKIPGASGTWIPMGDPRAIAILNGIHSPDGSTLDSVLP